MPQSGNPLEKAETCNVLIVCDRLIGRGTRGRQQDPKNQQETRADSRLHCIPPYLSGNDRTTPAGAQASGATGKKRPAGYQPAGPIELPSDSCAASVVEKTFDVGVVHVHVVVELGAGVYVRHGIAHVRLVRELNSTVANHVRILGD